MKRISSEPKIHVGILRSKSITIKLLGNYKDLFDGGLLSGSILAMWSDGHICMNGGYIDGHSFQPLSDTEFFIVEEVQIGIGFHWDRRENQTFKGSFHFVVDNDSIWLVNEINVEDYLCSVISSEMNAMSNIELLKAHAITSRSWLMAQIWGKGHFLGTHQLISYSKRLCWQDREDHLLFDVCADDHCQRYQGIGRINNRQVEEAVNKTRGLLLTYNGKVCDARFSKCCGGQSELFGTCWDDIDHPYLQSVGDAVWADTATLYYREDDAEKLILSRPDAYCNTTDKKVLSQILNGYDLFTTDFFRWKVKISAEELADIIRQKTGEDLGRITDLEPMERGASGRIKRLRICGTKKTMEVGKELEIRRLLSKTHLYSSAFVVGKDDDNSCFILHGAGWGHGVGLCQIGAAVMAHKGYSYRSILYHYFRKAQIEKMWD